MVDVAMNTKRFKVMRELISTEERYIDDLETCWTKLHHPLKRAKVLSPRDLHRLFCGVDSLLPLQHQLKHELSQAEVNDRSVGSVFIRFVPLLKMCVAAPLPFPAPAPPRNVGPCCAPRPRPSAASCAW